MRQFITKQFFVFVLTGGIAAIVNFSSRIIYNLWFDFSVAIILAYISGMITAFLLVKIFVFKTSVQKLHHSVFFFTLVNLIAVLQTWAISIGLAYYVLPAMGVTAFTKEIAHACGVVVPVFTSYLGHKHWSFR